MEVGEGSSVSDKDFIVIWIFVLPNCVLFSQVWTSLEGAATPRLQVETEIREREWSVGDEQPPYSFPGDLAPNATP